MRSGLEVQNKPDELTLPGYYQLLYYKHYKQGHIENIF